MSWKRRQERRIVEPRPQIDFPLWHAGLLGFELKCFTHQSQFFPSTLAITGNVKIEFQVPSKDYPDSHEQRFLLQIPSAGRNDHFRLVNCKGFLSLFMNGTSWSTALSTETVHV